MIKQIADLRAELLNADTSAEPSADLRMMASNFETGMIKIEEGGIICRQERKTGTRMSTQRCFTRKRLQEDSERSRDQLRDLRYGQGLPSGECVSAALRPLRLRRRQRRALWRSSLPRIGRPR